MKKAILLDRDGVINFDSKQYIKSVSEFTFIPGSVDAIVKLTQAGYRIGVATNQSGISRGLYSEQTLLDIHRYLLDTVEQQGGHIEAIEYCPHLPIERCSCRKPEAGMLYRLSEKMGIDLKDSYYLGDRISDILVAQKIQAQAVVILSKMTDRKALASFQNIPSYPSLLAFSNELLEQC